MIISFFSISNNTSKNSALILDMTWIENVLNVFKNSVPFVTTLLADAPISEPAFPTAVLTFDVAVFALVTA